MEGNMTKAQNKARAELVKKERTKRAFTQSHLAKLADVTLRTIQRLEKDGVASFETLMGVASAFEVGVEYLNPSARTHKKNDIALPEKEVHLLPRLKSGKEITDVIGDLDGNDLLQPTYDQISDKRAVDLVAHFFGLLGHVAINWNTFDHALKVHIASSLSEDLKKLESVGLSVFGIKRRVFLTIGDQQNRVEASTIFVIPSNYSKIVRNEKSGTETVPALLSTVARQKVIDSHSRRPFDDLMRPQNISQL